MAAAVPREEDPMNDLRSIQAGEAACAAARDPAVRRAAKEPGVTVRAIALRRIAAGEMPG